MALGLPLQCDQARPVVFLQGFAGLDDGRVGDLRKGGRQERHRNKSGSATKA